MAFSQETKTEIVSALGQNAGNELIAGVTSTLDATTVNATAITTTALVVNGGTTYANGTSIIAGTGSGLTIATAANQKVALHGATPTVQSAFIADPSGGGTVDTECRAAVVALIDAVIAKGIIAAS